MEEETIRFAFQVLLNPLLWNIVARLEYHYQLLSRVFCGHRYVACYFLAACIFSAGIWRDWLYKLALDSYEAPSLLQSDIPELIIVLKVVGAGLIAWGNVLVLTSMYQLGITGTYLGDYFGIYLDHRITTFPFNWYEHPMYLGSTLVFLGTGLWELKPVQACLMSAWVWIVYWIASVYFEGPFTTMIYQRKDANSKRDHKDSGDESEISHQSPRLLTRKRTHH